MIETNTFYTGPLKVGDFIGVAEGNAIYPGFFAGRGQGESFQYWSSNGLTLWMDDYQKMRTKGKKPHKSYHNAYNTRRAIKLHPDLLSPEHRIKYEKGVEALRILGVIV